MNLHEIRPPRPQLTDEEARAVIGFLTREPTYSIRITTMINGHAQIEYQRTDAINLGHRNWITLSPHWDFPSYTPYVPIGAKPDWDNPRLLVANT